MKSYKPYLFKSIYDWIIDNDGVPHILVNAKEPNVIVPQSYVRDGFIVLSMAATAIVKLDINESFVAFNARFNGKDERIVIPYKAMLQLHDIVHEKTYPLDVLLHIANELQGPNVVEETETKKEEVDKKDVSFTIL